MDPLFWILAGVVSICMIGIVVLWLMERRATRQLAAQQASDSARLAAVDPRSALEEIDTGPIPTTPQPSPQRTAHQQFPAPQSPFVPIQVSHPPEAAPVWAGAKPEPAAPAETLAAPQQEQLQTTPERAMLRAAELARERRSLEHLLEDNQTRLDTLLRGSALPDAESAATISLLQSELAGQRERLQEIIFLEQNYRQVASSVAEQLAQQKRQASPNTPGAFGVRRHPLARVQPPEQE